LTAAEGNDQRPPSGGTRICRNAHDPAGLEF